MRESKQPKPSGSAGGGASVGKTWSLFNDMMFLQPYLENRQYVSRLVFMAYCIMHILIFALLVSRKRGSLTMARNIESAKRARTSSPFFPRPDTPGAASSRASSPFSSPSSPAASDVLTPTNSLWDSTSQIFGEEAEREDDPVGEDTGADDSTNTPSRATKPKRSTMPNPDLFSKKKGKKMDRLESAVQMSAEAMGMLAQKFSGAPSSAQQEHPFMASIKFAFASVPKDKEMQCFLEMMDVIKRYRQQE